MRKVGRIKVAKSSLFPIGSNVEFNPYCGHENNTGGHKRYTLFGPGTETLRALEAQSMNRAPEFAHQTKPCEPHRTVPVFAVYAVHSGSA